MAYTYDPSIYEVKEGGWQARSQLGYKVPPCLTKIKIVCALLNDPTSKDDLKGPQNLHEWLEQCQVHRHVESMGLCITYASSKHHEMGLNINPWLLPTLSLRCVLSLSSSI